MPSREALEGLPVVEGSLPAGTKPTEAAWIVSNHVNQMAPVIALPSDGVYVGDGLAPVPAKLAARIRRGEYINMGELLPEFWSNQAQRRGEGLGSRTERNGGEGDPETARGRQSTSAGMGKGKNVLGN